MSVAFDKNKLEALADANRSDLPDVRAIAVCDIDQSQFCSQMTLSWKDRTELVLSADGKPNSDQELANAVFDVWICGHRALDHLGCPLYVEIAFKDTPSTKDSIERLQAARPSDSVLQDGFRMLLERLQTKKSLETVYVPAEIGHPHGHFFALAFTRPERLKAMVISFIGRINPVMCSHCINTYTGTVTSHKEHVLTPFHVCISEPGFLSGRCSNCTWQSYTDCEWGFLSGYQSKSATEGTMAFPLGGAKSLEKGESEAKYSVGPLNHRSCPRITKDWPYGDDDESDSQKLDEARAIVSKLKEDGFSRL